MPILVSLYFKHSEFIFCRQFNRNTTGKGILESIGQQIKNDLLPHMPVNIHRLNILICLYNELHPCFFNDGPEIGSQIGSQCNWVRKDITGLLPSSTAGT